MDGDTIAIDVGVSRVSGYYGPGAIGAWWLLTLSVLIGSCTRNCAALSSTKPPSIWNLFNIDADILAAVGYPAVASCDLLYNLKTYTSDPNSIALYFAPIVVLFESELLMICLLVAILVRDPEFLTPTIDLMLVALFLVYFYIMRQIALDVCMNKMFFFIFDSSDYRIPWCASDGHYHKSECQRSLDNCINGMNYADKPDHDGDHRPDESDDTDYNEVLNNIFAAFFIVCGVVGIIYTGMKVRSRGSGWTSLDYWYNMMLSLWSASRFYFGMYLWLSLVWPIVQDAFSLLVLFVLDFVNPGSKIPVRLLPPGTASLLDLDQMAALIVGGMVPLVVSAAPLLRRRLARFRRRLLRRNPLDSGDIV